MAVVQVFLMFGLVTWVLTLQLEKFLEGFHHQTSRRMEGMGPKCQRYRTWVYPSIGADLKMLELEEIGVYIACCQNTIAQYIATRPIVDLCLTARWKPGMRLSRRW